MWEVRGMLSAGLQINPWEPPNPILKKNSSYYNLSFICIAQVTSSISFDNVILKAIAMILKHDSRNMTPTVQETWIYIEY